VIRTQMAGIGVFCRGADEAGEQVKRRIEAKRTARQAKF